GTKVRWHYVLFDVLCEFIGGNPFPGTDAENARFVPLRELGEYDLAPTALGVLQAAAAARIGAGESISPGIRDRARHRTASLSLSPLGMLSNHGRPDRRAARTAHPVLHER